MNSRTHQISFYSQPVRLGLPVAPGVEHLADILADARALAFDAFEVLPLLHRAHFFSVCPVRRLRHCSSQSIKYHDDTSRFALLDFREHPFLTAFRP